MRISLEFTQTVKSETTPKLVIKRLIWVQESPFIGYLYDIVTFGDNTFSANSYQLLLSYRMT